MVQHCLRQSDRSLPDLHSFKVSFMKAKYTLSAHEKFSRLFALLLFCMTTFGWEHCMSKKVVHKHHVINRIHLMEMAIGFYCFVYPLIGSGQL